ncbi:hypothetical protein [Lentimonas sp. CC6]|uniref:hypothetical protein n=1 Tax=Lentimonas sp. CC6 TaxID=2676100 RepID=UPI00138A5571|nr:hypothetical protein [Lentimonas sp. CC6]
MWVAWGGMASAPSAEPQHRTSALNQSTHTPQDEAELIPPECVGYLGRDGLCCLPRSTLPSAEPQHSTKALNQSTHTPQDEAELIPPEPNHPNY